jgi:hypothetical protein
MNAGIYIPTFSATVAQFIGTAGALVTLAFSRSGLNWISSSTTYPAVVPSENVTSIPSLPSCSNLTILIALIDGQTPFGQNYRRFPIGKSKMIRGGASPRHARDILQTSGREGSPKLVKIVLGRVQATRFAVGFKIRSMGRRWTGNHHGGGDECLDRCAPYPVPRLATRAA